MARQLFVFVAILFIPTVPFVNCGITPTTWSEKIMKMFRQLYLSVTINQQHHHHIVMMESYIWRIPPILTLMGVTSMEGEWKCAMMGPFTQFVVKDGLIQMQLLSVTIMAMVILIIVRE